MKKCDSSDTTGHFSLQDTFYTSFSSKAFNTIKFWYLNKEMSDTQKVNKNGPVKPSPISILRRLASPLIFRNKNAIV